MEELLEVIVGRYLKEKNMKLMVAESCTGGLIGHRITNVPGCSDYYLGSVTAYAYEAKQTLLGVKQETLLKYGAVSRQTVMEMACGVRHALNGFFPLDKTVGVSVSGIAGPGGGMPDKPVGTVWVGLCAPEGSYAWRFQWHGDRLNNKEQSADATLQILLDYLNGCLPPESY